MNWGIALRARRVRVLVALGLAVSLVALVLLPLNGEYQRGVAEVKAKSAQPVALNVALVNEDRGIDAGGEQVNLGRGYVKQVESDTSAAWNVVSRGVAERGLTYGNYHLMVIIPAEFSEKLVDLESADPSPIGITYQVNGGGNVRVEAVADERGREIVTDLNGQLVDMYVASILGNLRLAQDNVQLVVDAEATNAGVFTDEVDPATRAFGTNLGVLTQSTDGSLSANDGLTTGLDGLTSDLQDSTLDHAEHDESLAALVAAREEGTLAYGTFLQSLMAMDSQLLSDEVQRLYDDLVATGDALREQFDAEADVPNHAGAVAALEALTDRVDASVTARVAALDGLDAAAVLDAYGEEIRAAVDLDGDGVVTLAEVLEAARGDAGTEAPGGPEFLQVVREAAAQEIAVLPYREMKQLAIAIELGTFGHAGGQFEDLMQQVRADLRTVLSWDGYGDVPEQPAEHVGSDIDAAIEDLVAAQSFPVELEPGTGEPEPDLEEEPDPEPEQDPIADAITELTRAAAGYGATVVRIVEAYQRAAELVRFADSCLTTCGLPPGADVTGAIDAILTRSVARQIAAEREHLAAFVALVGDLRSGMSEVTDSAQRLRATTQELSTTITGQLDSLAALRASMAQVLKDERPAARSVAETDAMTQSIVGEARALAASSEFLVLSAQSGVEQAGQIKTLLDGLRSDADGLLVDSADLDRRNSDLTGALSGQMESSQAFADSFAGVLPNAHSSGVLNERLMQFLVEPVVPTQRDSVASADVTRPFPWVLIAFSLCFMAAYLLAKVTWTGRQRSAFARGRVPWFRSNVRSLGVSSLVGTVLGAGLAWASGAGLGVPRESQVVWGAAVVLICLALTLFAHWLVKQWRAVGVGLCVVLLVGYVFVSDAVGTGVTSGVAGVMAAVNPLYHAEAAMRGLLGQDASGVEVLGRLLVGVLVAVVLNLLVRDDLRAFIPRRWRPASSAPPVPVPA